MVSFTCNTCGDSLKKKEVSIHFSRKFKCRQAASLTCFDCLKEFGQNYDSHTICVTEDQRYSAGGLSGISKNKQQGWNESVRLHLKSVLEAQKSTLPKSVVNVLEYVCKTSNIPRKEKAFMNFLRNTHRFMDNDMRAVWNIVGEFAKQENEAKADNTQKKGPINGVANGTTPATNGKAHPPKKDTSSQPIKEEVACNENKGGVDTEQKKKKKKSKKSESSEVPEIATNEEVSNDLNESKKQKKKKEKSETLQTSQDIPMEVEEVTGETPAEEEKLSKKEKKLKKKQEKYEAELKAVEATKANEEEPKDVEEPAVEEGKKKKKSKKQALEAEESLETDKKSKKKRDRTVSMAAETEQPKKKNKHAVNDENMEPNEVEEPEPNRKEFNWNSVIVEVLQSQDDKEMPIKRLCKKVVNEYLSSLLEGAHVDEVKATAKFQKKLHKTPGVFVHKDKAKLKVADLEN